MVVLHRVLGKGYSRLKWSEGVTQILGKIFSDVDLAFIKEG